ncbi:MAG: glycosyltransferase family 1 protein [Chloroflexi bacterium]|nr:MAG: glycosyltransferase family 1 protein [Chloroflexota bacterium]
MPVSVQAPIAVTVDVGPAVHQRAGLSRYSERLVAHLLAHEPAHVKVALFFNAHSGHQIPDSLRSAPAYTVKMGQLAWRLSALATQLLRWPHYERHLPPGQLYHATEHLLPRLRRPAVLTVHDLIFEHYPAHHTRRNRLFLRVALPRFVAAADAIIAVSEQTKRDLVEHYRTPAEKIQVIYQGIDPMFAPPDPAEIARVRQHYRSGAAHEPYRPYLLMVGTLEPRKNHALALRALARLKALGYPHRLLVVGGEGWLFAPVRQLVDELDLTGDVTFAGYVPNADLPALYAGAACVLQPSLYEGFGFPVLEAMACGAPVVCSNASSLPEVAGDAALLASPTDVDAWVAAIVQIIATPGVRESLSERGLRQARKFCWERCAATTAALYREVVQRAGAPG